MPNIPYVILVARNRIHRKWNEKSITPAIVTSSSQSEGCFSAACLTNNLCFIEFVIFLRKRKTKTHLNCATPRKECPAKHFAYFAYSNFPFHIYQHEPHYAYVHIDIFRSTYLLLQCHADGRCHIHLFHIRALSALAASHVTLNKSYIQDSWVMSIYKKSIGAHARARSSAPIPIQPLRAYSKFQETQWHTRKNVAWTHADRIHTARRYM